MPPWINPWLLMAEAVSFGLHFLILYVPFLADIFGIVPLSFQEWLLVIAFAFPVIIIDEVRTEALGCQRVRSRCRARVPVTTAGCDCRP